MPHLLLLICSIPKGAIWHKNSPAGHSRQESFYVQFSVLFRGAIQIMSMECPVFLRRDAFKPFEHLGKVGEIAIVQLHRNHTDWEIGVDKIIFGRRQLALNNEVLDVGAGLFFEQTGKILRQT